MIQIALKIKFMVSKWISIFIINKEKKEKDLIWVFDWKKAFIFYNYLLSIQKSKKIK